MRRAWLRKIFPRLLIFLISALISVALFQTKIQHSEPVPLAETTPTPVTTVTVGEDPEIFVDYEGDDKLFLHGYEVRKVDVTVPYEYPEAYSNEKTIDGTHVVVKRKGHKIAEFGGIYHPLGNIADFGLFNLLGTKSKQLIISLTVPRGGRHWVVSLDPKFRVLFDDADYSVGREEFSIVDVDKDGVHEICLPVVAFYMMEGLYSVGETPLPQIIFRYDAQQMKYLPANHLFVDYALRGQNPETEKEIYQHRRFDVLLNYIYAGKEKEGWASFDKYYPSPDKEVMTSRIKAILRDDPVYKYIYSDRKE